MKTCGNCVNRERFRRPDGSEFWVCEEYGIVYLGVPANVTPPADDACKFWTNDPKRKLYNYNKIMRMF